MMALLNFVDISMRFLQKLVALLFTTTTKMIGGAANGT
jgi:hypothetical protein